MKDAKKAVAKIKKEADKEAKRMEDEKATTEIKEKLKKTAEKAEAKEVDAELVDAYRELPRPIVLDKEDGAHKDEGAEHLNAHTLLPFFMMKYKVWEVTRSGFLCITCVHFML